MSVLVPKQRPARVTLTDFDGNTYTKDVPYAKGEPENPLSLEGFVAKFHDLAAFGGTMRDKAERIADAALNYSGSVRGFASILES